MTQKPLFGKKTLLFMYNINRRRKTYHLLNKFVYMSISSLFNIWFVFISFNDNHRRLFNNNGIFVDKKLWNLLIYCWEYKWSHAFLKCISSKVNVIERLYFEIVDDTFAVQSISYDTTETLTWFSFFFLLFNDKSFLPDNLNRNFIWFVKIIR